MSAKLSDRIKTLIDSVIEYDCESDNFEQWLTDWNAEIDAIVKLIKIGQTSKDSDVAFEKLGMAIARLRALKGEAS